MSEYHAIASPSSAEKWLACANSLAAELGQPDTAGAAADLGTAKHALLTMCLEEGKDAASWLLYEVTPGHYVDEAFAADVQNVVDNVRARIQNYENLNYRVEMDLEQDVPIGHITGEKGATGRADVVLRGYHTSGSFLDIIDSKFGYSEVSADNNPQLKMYAAGVVEKYSLTDEFATVLLVIEQPARSKESIESEPILVTDLMLWVDELASPAARYALWIRNNSERGVEPLKFDNFTVTEKGCQWCKAAAVCPARVAHVEEAIGAGFEVMEQGGNYLDPELIGIDQLAAKFEALEVIEDWIKAVRARIEFELLAGKKIPGVKLVAGKKGNRQWASDEEAEAMLKKFRVKLDQMYSFKLLGPKPILEVMKDRPRQLKHIEALIVQPAGKPHVALDSDKRPALEIKPAEDGFEAEDLC